MTRWNALFFDDLDALLRPEFARVVGADRPLRYLAAERRSMRGLLDAQPAAARELRRRTCPTICS